MNFKKTFIKSAAFALALGFIGFLSPQVTKAATAAATATFDGVEEKITTTGNKFWGIAKEVDEKKKDFSAGGKFYQVDEVAPIEGGTIDLSFLNKGKQLIIALGQQEAFEDSKWSVKVIEPQNKNFKAGFLKIDAGNVVLGTVTIPENQTFKDAELGAFAAINGETILNLPGADGAKVELKVGKSGSWVAANTFFGTGEAAVKATLTRLIQGGTEVTARYIGVKQADATAGSWASNEVKVKFPKQAKAPKLVVDTAKGIVNFKKGQEYKIAKGAAITTVTSWTVADGKKNFTGADSLEIDGTKDVIIQVRDAATAKKPASKITTVELTKQEAVTVAALTKGGGELVAGKLKLVMKVPYDISKGAYIENLTESDYEYTITQGNTNPADTAKWLKIRAGKKNKKSKTPDVINPSKTTIKYSKTAKDNAYSDDNAQTKIFVRLSGTKQDKNTLGAKLATAHANALFNLQNDKGELSAPGEAIEVSGKVNTAIVKTFPITIDKLFKNNATPKIKVTQKVNGVTVKASKMTKNTGNGGAGTLTVKVSKSAFKTAPAEAPKLIFKLSLEGVEKEVTATITLN